jgi:hypothetical protein
MVALKSLIFVNILTRPSEVPDPIPFEHDLKHAAYDPDYANRFWRILVEVNKIFRDFRSHFMERLAPYIFSGEDLI